MYPYGPNIKASSLTFRMSLHLSPTRADSKTENRLGSLVLGGFDQAHIGGEVVNFNISSGATSPELLVTFSTISIAYDNNTSPTSSPGGFTALIDSTLPYLYLPTDTCEYLARVLNLQYDNITGLYTIDENSLQNNKQTISTITIAINPLLSPGSTTSKPGANINFKYDAFVANADWQWGYESVQAIFPIRRTPAGSTTPAVLGRVFFQEAYVSADYERNVFNVSQVNDSNDVGSNIIPIPSLSSSSPGKSLSKGAIAGIAIGGFLAVLIIALICLWFCWMKPKRRRAKQKKAKEEEEAKREENLRLHHQREMSTVSSITAFSELDSGRGRPSIGGHRVSELSELSENSDRDRRGTVGSMHGIPELEWKTDAAELDENARIQNLQHTTSELSELEGEGHMNLSRPF
jgi:hypothetical protein